MTAITRALPLLTPRWLRLWPRFAALHWRHVAARELGSRVGTDPRVRERGGRVGSTLWLVTTFASPVNSPTTKERRLWRHRVRWLDLHRPDVTSERWVWSESRAYAWVALAATSPVLALLADDDEGPWTALRSVPEDEVRAALRAAGCEAGTIERVVSERQTPRKREG